MHALKIFIFALGLLGIGNCGTREGNGMVALSFGSYSVSQARKASALASETTSAVFCFKRLRFKADENADSTNVDEDPDNVDFEIGEVTISPSGTNLGSIVLKAGTYRRIDFDLDKNCGSGKSVSVTNNNGTFSTTDHITVKFYGSFTMTTTNANLTLAIKTIMDALNGIDSGDSIKTQIHSVRGGF